MYTRPESDLDLGEEVTGLRINWPDDSSTEELRPLTNRIRLSTHGAESGLVNVRDGSDE